MGRRSGGESSGDRGDGRSGKRVERGKRKEGRRTKQDGGGKVDWELDFESIWVLMDTCSDEIGQTPTSRREIFRDS